MTVDYCVISIGTLSRNLLWGEGGAVRTPHATTILVDSGEGRLILVDPSLTPTILAARFNERTGKRLQDVTDVFCTTLRPVHRGSIEALPHAKWWCNAPELEAYGQYLQELLDTARRLESDQQDPIDKDLSLLKRFAPAPEKFGPQVHLYPLPGPSAGSAGLLLTPPTTTVLLAGDAGLTREHVLRGQVWEGCLDTQAAMDSLQDLLELADTIVPGHDNVFTLGRRI